MLLEQQPDHRLFTKLKSKWIIDLSLRLKTTKLMGDNLGDHEYVQYDDDILDMTQDI
jgi:hypothetical protein